MQVIANLIVPIITLIVIIYGLYKKINIYDVFMEGVMEGLKIVLNILQKKHHGIIKYSMVLIPRIF